MQFIGYFTSTRWLLIFFAILIASCGGGGGSSTNDADSNSDTDEVTDADTSDNAPTVEWSFQTDVKHPATDLSTCAMQVMDCMTSSTSLDNCFSTIITVCPAAEATDGCCMQACGDQLAELLAGGMSEQQAFLSVFVDDGSCMLGIEAEAKQ